MLNVISKNLHIDTFSGSFYDRLIFVDKFYRHCYNSVRLSGTRLEAGDIIYVAATHADTAVLTSRRNEQEKKMSIQSSQTTIYIGLNDGMTGVQKFDSNMYISTLKYVCRSYKIGFSFQEISGGYFHEDGSYTEENALMLRLINVPEQTIIEIAKDICVFFNQESVMITTSPTSVVYITDKI